MASRAVGQAALAFDVILFHQSLPQRLLDGEPLKQKWPQRFGQAQGHLKQVDEPVRMIKDGKRYWVSKDLTLKPARIKRVYCKRQPVEGVFRLLKQAFGWD